MNIGKWLGLLCLFLVAALAGCSARTPAQLIAGTWQGRMTAGDLTIPAVWEMHDNGTQSLTLSLPQGLLTAQGTFTLHEGMLTQRTTSRVIAWGSEKKIMPLVNPMETIYHYQVTDDTLTLTEAGSQENISLTREKQ